ncbi:LrgB family protein [Clostridium sp.]|jgi:predicted murein hydrolase (TIGR00659 family)|uniref:LrgB family protein n=1 Tax=Clostridium sp. TaxID=1506 RepID=UPI002FDD789B
MNNLINTGIFGILTSLIAYEIGMYINKNTNISIFNPLLIAIVLIIFFLMGFHIKYESFNIGGDIISFFLYPATVALAVPLYKEFSLFKKNVIPILTGILCGCIVGILSIIAFSKIFGLSNVLIQSLIPKSITTPIGMALSKQLGGLPSITVIAIIITGILGSIVGPFLFKLLKIKDKVAFGVAMGTSSHAIGTAKTMEIGETEGAMSGLAMAISGIVTVFIAPVLWQITIMILK